MPLIQTVERLANWSRPPEIVEEIIEVPQVQHVDVIREVPQVQVRWGLAEGLAHFRSAIYVPGAKSVLNAL